MQMLHRFAHYVDKLKSDQLLIQPNIDASDRRLAVLIIPGEARHTFLVFVHIPLYYLGFFGNEIFIIFALISRISQRNWNIR